MEETSDRRRWNKAAIAVGVIGRILSVVGFVLFMSILYQVLTRPFETPNFAMPIIGFILLSVGSLLLNFAIGAGVVTNVKPLARWTGSIVREAASEFRRTTERETPNSPHQSTVEVRCPSCSTVNDEHVLQFVRGEDRRGREGVSPCSGLPVLRRPALELSGRPVVY